MTFPPPREPETTPTPPTVVSTLIPGLRTIRTVQPQGTAHPLQNRSGNAGDVVVLHGYYEDGDGGGGLFRWDAADNTGHDGGTIIVPNSADGRWVRQIFGTRPSPKWWGAVGAYDPADAEADTAGVQACVDYCIENAVEGVIDGIFAIEESITLAGATGLVMRAQARSEASLGAGFFWAGDTWDGAAVISSTSTSVGADTLTDTMQAMTVNAFAGYRLTDDDGVAWLVVSNTATAFTLKGNGDTPASGSYTVERDDQIILEINEHDAGTFENVAFHGSALAKHCIRLRQYAGDVRSIRAWSFPGCYFGSALVHDFIVEGTGADYYGDGSNLKLDPVYFGPPQGGAQPVAHYRQTAPNTFGVDINANFDALPDDDAGGADEGWPTYGVSIAAGTVNVRGTFDPVGTACVHMDGLDGVPLPSLTIDGVEAQSGKRLLLAQTAGTGGTSALRSTVLTGVFGDDIIAPTETEMITWDVGLYGSLVLNGCHVAGDIRISDDQATVFAVGAVILGNYGFVGQPETVQGFWMQNGRRRQQGIAIANYNGDPATPMQVGAESGGDAIAVTFTLGCKAKTQATVWISDAAIDDATVTAPTGGVVVVAKIIKTLTTGIAWELVSDANGDIALVITQSGARTMYVNVSVPGCPVVSQAITFAA